MRFATTQQGSIREDWYWRSSASSGPESDSTAPAMC